MSRIAVSSAASSDAGPAAPTVPPPVLWLDDPDATSADVAGAKAANLARATAGGLPVLPGFVVTTAASSAGTVAAPELAVVRAAYEELVRRAGTDTVVVRSSSTAEDTSASSMAGQFTSVLGVEGWAAVDEAVRTVLRSAAHPKGGATAARPMAVLVQPELPAACGGVLFGLDPVTGDRHHLVVEAVAGSPDALVSGRSTAQHAVLTRHGHLTTGQGDPLRALLDRGQRRRLAALARRAERVFGRPQDVEWAIGPDGRLWLLQSRDVTAHGDAALARGPVLGPGPVAETFPDPLRPLEIELWLEPLREAVVGALQVTGAVPPRRLAASPVVLAVRGRVAADLELFGILPHGGVRRRLNPLRGGRRLLAAWRVGRLRSALPGLIDDVLAGADADLVGVPPLASVGDPGLLDLVDRARRQLVALHGHEILAGMLLPPEPTAPSLPTVALAALGPARSGGVSAEAVLAAAPVVLALVPPAIGSSPSLPASRIGDGYPAPIVALGRRDALRLRCRWVQELSARAVEELGRRLVARDLLADLDDLPELHLADLRAAVAGVACRRPTASLMGPPLPVAFRLAATEHPIAVATGRDDADGLAAGGGRGSGIAHHDPAQLPDRGAVLVVDVLDPRLAAVLGRLAGLVSETGSALSHLAILAREQGVPAVVAVPDARRRFPPGTRLLVDGDTGRVTALGDPA